MIKRYKRRLLYAVIILFTFFLSTCDWEINLFPLPECTYNLYKYHIIEDFEEGEIYDLETGGDSKWRCDVNEKCAGDYSLRSGSIGDSGETYIRFKYYNESSSTLRFYYQTSSEYDYDYLRFYVDNSLEKEWSGCDDGDWDYYEYDMFDPGEYVFKWTYEKDGIEKDCDDCVWIDNLEIF
ncbi:MAG: hypothetical protein JW881_13805 [Spirochaetales bacterium]|nr:hypothetical protein [Spirochaetales bacterium]